MQVPPTTFTFSGHETFPFRYSWLKKGLDAVTEDSALFLRDRAMVVLGVGKNMVRSIRHWCLAAGILETLQGPTHRPTGHLRPTWLGTALLADDGWDPYLEDPATLWLLHWQLASNARRCTRGRRPSAPSGLSRVRCGGTLTASCGPTSPRARVRSCCWRIRSIARWSSWALCGRSAMDRSSSSSGACS